MENISGKRLVGVFAGNEWQTGMVKSLLENEGIVAFLKDGLMGTIDPGMAASGGTCAIKVWDSVADFAEAEKIADDYQYNLRAKN